MNRRELRQEAVNRQLAALSVPKGRGLLGGGLFGVKSHTPDAFGYWVSSANTPVEPEVIKDVEAKDVTDEPRKLIECKGI